MLCTGCGFENSELESDMPSMITADLPQSAQRVPLQSCLDNFSKPEDVPGWRCPNCQLTNKGKKSQHLAKTAHYLFVHINRIGIDEQKNTTPVLFPREQVTLEVSGKKQAYEAISVVEHMLPEVAGRRGTDQGHWTCSRLLDGEWWWCSDLDVEILEGDDFAKHDQATIALLKAVEK